MLNLFYLAELLHTEQRIPNLDHCPGVSSLGSLLRWLEVFVWNFLAPPLVAAEKTQTPRLWQGILEGSWPVHPSLQSILKPGSENRPEFFSTP